jgi:hypothetical protein
LGKNVPGLEVRIWRAWQAMVTAQARGAPNVRARELAYEQAVSQAVKWVAEYTRRESPNLTHLHPGGLVGGPHISGFKPTTLPT